MKERATRKNIAGLFSVLPTPFAADGTLDESLFGRMLKALAPYRFRGLVLSGTNGEYFSTSRRDRIRIVELTAEFFGGQGPLLVANSTSLTLGDATELGRDLVRAGADALINIPTLGTQFPHLPYIEYWRRLAGGVGDVPLLMYTMASLNQLPATATIAATAAAVPTICGTKEGHNDLARWEQLQGSTDIVAIPADDFHWIEYYTKGCTSFMTPTASMLPAAAVQMHEQLLRRPRDQQWPGETCTAYQAAFIQLWKTLVSLPALADHHLVARVKATCKLAGYFDPGHVAPPIFDLPEPALRALEKEIRGILALAGARPGDGASS